MSLSDHAKYRPVLLAHQIAHICDLCRRDGSNQSLEVLATLTMYEFKIKNRAITPAYVQQPKQSLEASLGFSSNDSPGGYIQAHKDHVHTDEALYSIWADDPGLLNVEQLKRVRTYRYTNNKMTNDEERKYESEILGMDVGPT
jgi:hypothetical protein